MSWALSRDAAQVSGRLRGMPYDGAGAWDQADWDARQARERVRAGTGVEPHAIALGRMIRAAFPWVHTVGFLRGTRLRRGSDQASVHAVGRALDVMMPANGDARGEALANWLVENAQPLGVQLVIWDRSEWQPGRSHNGVADPNARATLIAHPGNGDASSAHTNHVHVEVTRAPGLGLAAASDPPHFVDEPEFLNLTRDQTHTLPNETLRPAVSPGPSDTVRQTQTNQASESGGMVLLALVALALLLSRNGR